MNEQENGQTIIRGVINNNHCVKRVKSEQCFALVRGFYAYSKLKTERDRESDRERERERESERERERERERKKKRE